MDRTEKKKIWKAMLAKQIKINSPLWAVEVHPGRTLAHDAAYLRLLPEDFKCSFIKDDRNMTVAQVSAMRGIQISFQETDKSLLEQEEENEQVNEDTRKSIINMFDWCFPEAYWITHKGAPLTYKGVPLTHEAARFGVLPSGFSFWFVKDDLGWTAAQEADYWGVLPSHVVIGEDDLCQREKILLPLANYKEICRHGLD